jgi:hypothetical protein
MTIEVDEPPGLLDSSAAAESEVPRIYLASPLTNLQRDERISILSQVENVKNRIDRMTIGDRADGEGWPVSVYAPIEHTPPWEADDLSATDVYQRNLTELLDSDALIVIAARAASAGVGQEIEWAARAPMPILYLSSGSSISRQIAGIPASITVQTYGDDYSLLGKKVGLFLQHRRHDICDGPRRRASKRLRFAVLTQQLQLAWARAANRTELAATCGLPIPMIDSMLADSARVATMPVDALTALSEELGIDPLGAGRQLSVRDMRALVAAAEEFGWDDALVETVRARGLEILGAEPNPRLDTPDRWRALLSPDQY